MHSSKSTLASTHVRLDRRQAVGRLGAVAAAGLLGLLGTRNAFAQSYPSRPVRLLVGSPAGGLADVIARATAQKLGDALGQAFIVDNKPGASGVIATDALAKSAPDGYTLFVTPDSMIVVNQFVYPKLPYDPNKDIVPVALIGKATLVLVANPSLGVKTAAEFIAHAKEKPRSIDYGTGGAGHPTHLSFELLQRRTGIALNAVPYKGTAPAMQGLLGGEVQAMVVGVAEAMPHIRSGKLVALAASGPAAREIFPDLPLFTQFHPDLDLSVWFGVFAPAGIKAEVVTTLNTEVNKFLRTSEARGKLAEFGITPMPSRPAELDAIVQADRAKYGPLIKALGITAA
jgi:tripartite-type tricarboxylate transporter receptor subunit TctC